MTPTATINAKNPDLNSITRLTWEAIGKVNDPPQLFWGENAIVYVNVVPEGLATCMDVDTNLLRWWLTKNIKFVEQTKNGEQAARPPADLLQNLIATPTPALPVLLGIVESPVFARNRTLHSKPGYSPQTQRVYAPATGLKLPAISNQPTSSEIDRAREFLLNELLGDFPFDGNSSKAHAIAALLVPFVRPMIDGPTPLHFISKPKAGTGATLLAEILCLPSGGSPSLISVPNDEGERKRTLLSVLRERPSAIVLDNVNKLEGAALASCLTQTRYQDREVGASRMLKVPALCLWLATGNNPDLSDEIARRVVRIHLDAKTEHPDLRNDFKYPRLKTWATEQIGNLVWSALTLVQAWIVAGSPAGQQVFGGFEAWAEVMGGILQVVGVQGFLKNIEQGRENCDRQTARFKAFVDTWAATHGGKERTAGQLLSLPHELSLGTQGERSQAIRLGQLLDHHKGQRFGVWAIKRRLLSGRTLWRLNPND